jgi:hypothetical protein
MVKVESNARPGSKPTKPTITCLADLALTPEDLGGLTRQGFVSREFRGTRGPYFKLRFRSRGQQKVRCLGQDQVLVERIERELFELQNAHRQVQELGRLAVQSRQVLRATKAALKDTVESAGFRFHGFAVRRSRSVVCSRSTTDGGRH